MKRRRFLPWALVSVIFGCGGDEGRIPLVLEVGGRSMSKFPFVLAADQGIYEKHGLDVELRLPPPRFEGGIEPRPGLTTRVRRRLGLDEVREVDIQINGHTPNMVAISRMAGEEKWIAIGATDCSVRYYVIAAPGVTDLEQLEGGRLGVNRDETTSGFAGMLLIERMGWDRDFDISVLAGSNVASLRGGFVDALVGSDDEYEAAMREGFEILVDTRTWNEELAGNSVLVRPEWLDDETNREAARRFLRALAESIALYYRDPEVAIHGLERWYGMSRDIARGRYERTDYIPRRPYPCIRGIRNTMALYDSHEMRRYVPEDFYDDALMREIDQSGFIDGLDTELAPDQPGRPPPQ